MKKSQETINSIKKKRIFQIISLSIMFSTIITYVILMISGMTTTSDESLKEKLGTVLYSMGMTLVILVLCLIFIGHKFRTSIWMAALVLGACLFSKKGMYLTLVLWAVDEYIFFALWQKYALESKINKTMDKRS